MWGRQCYGHVTGRIIYIPYVLKSGDLAKNLRKVTFLSWFLSVCLSVCLSISLSHRPSVCVSKWEHSTHKEWISMKFYIVIFWVKYIDKIQLWLQSKKKQKLYMRVYANLWKNIAVYGIIKEIWYLTYYEIRTKKMRETWHYTT
jgi:hypothetical protein